MYAQKTKVAMSMRYVGVLDRCVYILDNEGLRKFRRGLEGRKSRACLVCVDKQGETEEEVLKEVLRLRFVNVCERRMMLLSSGQYAFMFGEAALMTRPMTTTASSSTLSATMFTFWSSHSAFVVMAAFFLFGTQEMSVLHLSASYQIPPFRPLVSAPSCIPKCPRSNPPRLLPHPSSLQKRM